MKKEYATTITGIMKRTALLLCAAMLLPMTAVGCESAQEIIKKRERADEVGKLAEQYMQEKYNRGFKVRKCEAAEGDEYKDDFFISFNNGVHAFYDADEDLFYDDRQAESINENLIRDIWLPMFQDLGVIYENVNDWSQSFNVVYHYMRGGTDHKFSMYHEEFTNNTQYYAVHSKLFVNAENLLLVSEKRDMCKPLFDKVHYSVDKFFKGQAKGDLNFYVITPQLLARQDFKPEEVDETVHGCLAHFSFKDKYYMATPNFARVSDGLYVNLCNKDAVLFNDGDVTLEPVEDFDTVSKSIVENMDTKEISLLDKYTAKKRNIDFEGQIYKVRISSRINQKDWTDVTLAFMMKDGDEPLTEYAEMNEKEHSMFAYNMNGKEYNATCLCSENSRSVMFNYNVGDEVYFWFGTQS